MKAAPKDDWIIGKSLSKENIKRVESKVTCFLHS